jgi:biopolymer transport protein ExbD
MFFLLLFFLIASTMATPSVLKLLLPNAKTGIQAVKHPVVISVSADGQFAVNQTIVVRETLEQTLLNEIKGQEDPTALLKVDKSVPWEDVVFLLDVGNKNKVKMVAATSLTKYEGQ